MTPPLRSVASHPGDVKADSSLVQAEPGSEETCKVVYRSLLAGDNAVRRSSKMEASEPRLTAAFTG